MRTSRPFRRGMMALFIVLLASVCLSGQVSYQDLLQPPAANWPTYSGDLTARRFSLLQQITTQNVGRLAARWVYHVNDSKRLSATPLVANGVMYMTDANQVHALDARTGRRIWYFEYSGSKERSGNRGVALLGDKVFVVSSDAHLIALHARTGDLLWDQPYADRKENPKYSATLAPLAIDGKVIVGVSGGDCGIRGYVNAHDAETGRELWRFYTIPGAGEPGSETWGGHPADFSGGATWMTGTYDPQQNLLFWTTGNPGPDFYGGNRPGDNLYSDSVVALDADTGKLRWHFQFTPHDTHDWDAQEFPVLIDADFQGKPRRLLVQANRNGFFYVLDRTDGRMLLGKAFVDKLTWAKGVLPDGRPDLVPNMDPTPEGREVCPGVVGATNWFSPSYHPGSGLFYVMSLEQCDLYKSSARPFNKEDCYDGTSVERLPTDPGQFFLRALDLQTGERKWEIPLEGPDTYLAWPGTMATAGDLVFFGDDAGYLAAADARSGKVLWRFYTGHLITASPMTYQVGDTQYVALAAGTNVFSFALFPR